MKRTAHFPEQTAKRLKIESSSNFGKIVSEWGVNRICQRIQQSYPNNNQDTLNKIVSAFKYRGTMAYEMFGRGHFDEITDIIHGNQDDVLHPSETASTGTEWGEIEKRIEKRSLKQRELFELVQPVVFIASLTLMSKDFLEFSKRIPVVWLIGFINLERVVKYNSDPEVHSYAPKCLFYREPDAACVARRVKSDNSRIRNIGKRYISEHVPELYLLQLKRAKQRLAIARGFVSETSELFKLNPDIKELLIDANTEKCFQLDILGDEIIEKIYKNVTGQYSQEVIRDAQALEESKRKSFERFRLRASSASS